MRRSALPTSWTLCFVVGAAVRVHRDRLAVPPVLVPVALTALAVLGVVPLRGHTLTDLAGGPVIAALTGTLVLAWRTWDDVEGPLGALVLLGTVSYGAYLWSYPLSPWLRAVPATVLTLVAAAHSWRSVGARPSARPVLEPATS